MTTPHPTLEEINTAQQIMMGGSAGEFIALIAIALCVEIMDIILWLIWKLIRIADK